MAALRRPSVPSPCMFAMGARRLPRSFVGFADRSDAYPAISSRRGRGRASRWTQRSQPAYMRVVPLLLGILANIIGGSTYFIQKTALESWPPAMMVVARMAIALFPLLLLSPRRFAATR